MKKRIKPIVQIKKNRKQPIGESSNGRTADFDSANIGSIPISPAKIAIKELPPMWAEGARTDHRVKPKISYSNSWRLN